jgi:hypothetical protein
MLEGVKATFQKANCMLRADPQYRDVVVKYLVVWVVTLRLLVGCDNPATDLHGYQPRDMTCEGRDTQTG